MDIQTEKIELAKLILNTNDKVLIDKIMTLFKEKEEDWWDELPATVKAGIKESIGQANRGDFISYDEVKKRKSVLCLKNETRNYTHSKSKRYIFSQHTVNKR